VRVVAYQRPAAEVLEDGGLVVVEDRDVDVEVLARPPAEPGVGGPTTAQEPPAVNPVRRSRTYATGSSMPASMSWNGGTRSPF
jgi:hypothetical protein